MCGVLGSAVDQGVGSRAAVADGVLHIHAGACTFLHNLRNLTRRHLMGAFAPSPTGKFVLGGILGGNHCIAHRYGVALYSYAGGALKCA